MARGTGNGKPNGRDVAFPLTAASIDVGSNAIRLLAAEFSGVGDWRVLLNERRPVRLGHGVHLAGRLDATALEAAVAALVDFRRLIDQLAIRHIRAVATSAVRESRNRAELIERVRDEARLDLEVITGSEEARLIHLAVASRVPLGDRQWLLVDLGGGSVEVSVVDSGGILWNESHTMGAVRLLEELTEAGSDPGRFHRLLTEYVSVLRVPPAVERRELAGYIATGGNIEVLARLAGEAEEAGVSTLPLEALQAVIDRLARLSFRQRVEELGLREDRADVILPAAMVYERLGRLCGARAVIVPRVGIKEGVIQDLVSSLARHHDHEERQERELLAGAVALGRKYHFDEAHGRHVARLATSLFDQLRSLHGLDPTDRRLLQAAALLHDIGQFVSYTSHHKHSLYLISHSELPTLSGRDMLVAANVARYHRKGAPALHHPAFAELGEADRRRVAQLAALLRLADALDREHLQRVRAVRARVGPREVTLWLEGEGEMLLEGWSLKAKAELFRAVFDRTLRLRWHRSGGAA